MTLGWIDLTVLIAYFVITIVIGFWFGRGEKNTHDFFLGGRRQHWLLAGISIIATEISAVTFIGVPADAFRGDWYYLQMYAGSFVGRMLIVLLLLPAFYGGAVTTVYEYLGQRFGPRTRTTASIMFFVSRIIGSGLRLLLASLAVSVIFDFPLIWVIVASAGIATLYATFGGIKAILWTDAFQAAIFTSAAAVAVITLFTQTRGDLLQNFSTGWHAEKFRVFVWDWNPNNDHAFWVLFIHATILNMAALGVDQDLTQRMLTCRNLREGQKSLIFNAFAGFPIVCLFLGIGTLLWIFYQSHPESLPESIKSKSDRIFPYYIATALPHNVGLKGLMISAVFAAAMGSLSSAIGALASTAVNDFYRVLSKPKADERHYLWVARAFTLGFGLLLGVSAWCFRNFNELLWEVFKWPSLVFGGMLGIFLLGVTTRNRGDDRVNTFAMIATTALIVALKLYQESTGTVFIAWPWWVVLGTGITYLLAVCFRTQREGEPFATIEKKRADEGI